MQNMENQFLLYLNGFLKSVQSYAHHWNLPDLNTVTILAIFIFLVVFLLGVTFVKSRLLVGLVSLYIARLLESNFLYFDKLRANFPSFADKWLHLGLFVVFSMIIFILLQRSTLGNHLSLSHSSTLFTALFSVLTIGFLVSVILPYLPTGAYSNIRPELLQYFVTSTARFWWSAAPLLALIFLKKTN